MLGSPRLAALDHDIPAAARGAAYLEIAPDDRIAPPLSHARKWLRRLAMLALVGSGVGWAHDHDPTLWPRLASTIADLAKPRLDRPMADAPPLAIASDPASTRASPVRVGHAAPVEDGVSSPTVATSRPPPMPSLSPPASPPASPSASAPATAGTTASEAPPPAPVVQPTPEVLDPLQLRAKAVGLHPGLSQALLSRLTDADYRNAGQAIATALALPAGDASFVWPRQRKAGLAVFEVRFVPGAAAGCRRYVVIIEKDRWLTTSQPVEACAGERRPPDR